MRNLVLGVAAATLISTPVLASQPIAAFSVASAAKDAAARTSAGDGRVLYVCDSSAETRRGFQRTHGAAVFMKAEDVMKASNGWDGARCITGAEAAKLKRMQTARR